MKKYKKPLLIGLIALDVAITVFLFVISVIILVKVAPANGNIEAVIAKEPEGLIKYLLQHSTFYLCLFVIPLFALLAVNIVALVFYVKKTAKQEPTKLEDLSDEQKEALRQELLKDLQGEKKEE